MPKKQKDGRYRAKVTPAPVKAHLCQRPYPSGAERKEAVCPHPLPGRPQTP